MRLSSDELTSYRDRYDARYQETDDGIVERELKEWFKLHRYLDREHFIKLGLWKSKRPKKNYESEENDDLTVTEITKFALSSKNERVKIKSLMVLKGVSWPVASVILHFANPDQYPILDFRVIWSLGWQQPVQYSFDFWQRYVNELSRIAGEQHFSLRDLDKALWQYSKEKQISEAE